MIGKVILLLLAVFVVFLLITPFFLRVSYADGVLGIKLGYGLKEIVVFPRPEQESEQEKTQKPKQQTKKKQVKEKKIKPKPNREQIIYTLDVLPRVLLRAICRTAQRIRISPLKLHVLVAGTDPADTAVLYGRLHGMLAATLPQLHRAVRIHDQDIQLFPDFCEERMDLIADAGIRIRPWDILVVVFFAAAGIVKWYIGYRKRADHLLDAEKKKQKGGAQADSAA